MISVTTAIRAEVPAGVEVLHTEILETGEVDAPNTPPAKAAASMVSHSACMEAQKGKCLDVRFHRGECSEWQSLHINVHSFWSCTDCRPKTLHA